MASATAIRALLGLEPNEVVICLLTISHPAITAIQVTNDNTDQGAFLSYPFTITLPSDTEDTASAQLEIANVDRSIIEAIEAMDEAATATVQVVLASSPGTVEFEWTNLEVRNVRGNDLTVTASLSHPAVDNMPYPPMRVTMRDFPGLYVVWFLMVTAVSAILSTSGLA